MCDFQVLPSIVETFGMVLDRGLFGWGSGSRPATVVVCMMPWWRPSPYYAGRVEPEQTGWRNIVAGTDTASRRTMDVWRAHLLLMAENIKLREQSRKVPRSGHVCACGVVAPQWFRF